MPSPSFTILLADDDDLKRGTIAQFLMQHFVGSEILWVRDNLGNVPVIMVSGNPDIEAKAMEAGASAVLSSVRCLEVGIILKRLLEES